MYQKVSSLFSQSNFNSRNMSLLNILLICTVFNIGNLGTKFSFMIISLETEWARCFYKIVKTRVLPTIYGYKYTLNLIKHISSKIVRFKDFVVRLWESIKNRESHDKTVRVGRSELFSQINYSGRLIVIKNKICFANVLLSWVRFSAVHCTG
jgi:hypothetical protein